MLIPGKKFCIGSVAPIARLGCGCRAEMKLQFLDVRRADENQFPYFRFSAKRTAALPLRRIGKPDKDVREAVPAPRQTRVQRPIRPVGCFAHSCFGFV